MAYTDTFGGTLEVRFLPKITTTDGLIEGKKSASHKFDITYSDGTGSGAAQGLFSGTFTATTGGITVSLADSADPLGTAGDDVPTSDPEGLKLRAIMIENLDDTNYIKVQSGTNGDTNLLSGGTDYIPVTAGGLILWVSPAGVNAMNDGTDDELLITADTASCSVKLTYIFG